MPEQQDRGRRVDSPVLRVLGPSLAGRRALVVGGTGGIGRAICAALAARGASVVVHGGASQEGLDVTLAMLRNISGRLRGGAGNQDFQGFLREIDRPSHFLAGLPDLGHIDVLVVAHGPFVQKSLGLTTAEDWERMALIDLALPGALASAFLPAMMEAGWGRMLFMGGTRTDGIRAYRSNTAYAAAKTGLAVLAKSLAVEGAPRGVACLLVCPGLVDTEYLDEGSRESLEARAPGGRLLDPREVAEPAVELLSAEPCVASGAVITLDGGLGL